MDRSHAREIVANWMFPTVKSSYMGGAEDRPIIAKSEGSTFTDTDGKTYLDFQSGQMGQHSATSIRASSTPSPRR